MDERVSSLGFAQSCKCHQILRIPLLVIFFFVFPFSPSLSSSYPYLAISGHIFATEAPQPTHTLMPLFALLFVRYSYANVCIRNNIRSINNSTP